MLQELHHPPNAPYQNRTGVPRSLDMYKTRILTTKIMEPYHKGSSSLTTRKYFLECLFQGMIVEVGFEPTKHYATDLKPASFNHSETQLYPPLRKVEPKYAP